MENSGVVSGLLSGFVYRFEFQIFIYHTLFRDYLQIKIIEFQEISVLESVT